MIRVTVQVTCADNPFNHYGDRVELGQEPLDWFNWDFNIPDDIDPDIPSDCAIAAESVATACGMRVLRIFVTGTNADGNVDETYVPLDETP